MYTDFIHLVFQRLAIYIVGIKNMSIIYKGVLKIWKISEDYHLLYQLHTPLLFCETG